MSYFDNHFLFSETYIKEFINLENKRKDNEDVINAFRQIKEWNSEYTEGDYSKDPWLDYINAVLDVLKFEKKSDQSVIELFAYDSAKKGFTVAVCYTIDKNSKISSTKKGMYYAYEAVKAARKYGTEWAMLTNGYQWRLYHAKNVSPYENYLEIDIEESIKNNKVPDEAFKLFHLFFNARTFSIEEGELKIEKIKTLSDKKAEIIEESLRGKAEEMLKELCYGLKENMNQEHYTEKEKKSIYNDAIILLYRLLFFGYAESRKLLPIVDDDPGYPYSFKKLCEEAKDLQNSGNVHKIKDEFDFWDRLDTHIRIYVDRSYNGGLFHNDDKAILKKHRIANGRLSKCLAELTYNMDKSGSFSIPIEYKDLSVRNLGSIYEGLLEYRLFIADEQMVQRKSKGKVKYLKAAEVKLQNSDVKNLLENGDIYLSQDALERKETGAYYTPEDVVEYIVENTVGKKLEALRTELKDQQKYLLEQLSYENDGSMLKRGLQNQIDELTIRFIYDKILGLSIIDSAMGSGHFLVNAAYRVANEIVDIVSENKWETTNDDIIADVLYWKRKVVENCIYGIDINGLSVALARLSLWLISASNDKALSFIDHHLKEGNSIIGTDRKHVEVKDTMNPILDVAYTDYMNHILRKYEELKIVGSNTKADVARQKEIYDEINEGLKLVKKKYDYYLASQYAGEVNKDIAYINMLRSNNLQELEKPEMESKWITAEEMKFFHWELEFPEVFRKGGFDISIGNPPYIELKDCQYKPSIECVGNLYTSFIIQALEKCVNNGLIGFIVPLSSICTDRTKRFQKILISETKDLKIANFSWRPGKIFNNVHLQVTIMIGNKCENSIDEKKDILTTRYNTWTPKERSTLFKRLQFVNSEKYLWEGSIPKIGEQMERDILDKLYLKKRRFKSYISRDSSNILYYRRGGLYFKIFTNFETGSSEEKIIEIEKKLERNAVVSIFNSSTWFWFFTVYSDCRHLGKREIEEFPVDFNDMDATIYFQLVELGILLSNDLKKNAKIGQRIYKGVNAVECYQFYAKNSMNIIDKIDDLLGIYYGFTDSETDFLKNYHRSFRLYDEVFEQ